MPDLESSITNWRRDLLAANIPASALDELEGHLREEIARQTQAGVTGSEAFASATAQIGRADLLKTEFKKADGFLGWLGETRETQVRRVLALLWLARCSYGLIWITVVFSPVLYRNILYGHLTVPGSTLVIVPLLAVINFSGVVASLRLYVGKGGARIIQFIASLHAALFLIQFILFRFASPLGMAFVVFDLLSIWLLWPRRKAKLAAN